eukprot:m.53437 g.53437  ORF g.53437 m.53437 type:complete len:317 (-) comp6482_c0_seq2:165-1115(-)
MARRSRALDVAPICERLLANDPSLTMISAFDAPVGEEAARRLGETLPRSTHLALFWLGNCSVTATTFELLLPGLLRNESITNLMLSSNPIGDSAAAALGAWAAKTARLTHLVLGQRTSAGCGISLSGLNAMLPGLQASTLALLDLSGNGFGDEGARGIAGWLAANPPLKTLILVNCGITSEGAAALVASLRTNNCLISLRIDLAATPGQEGIDAALRAGSEARAAQIAQSTPVEAIPGESAPAKTAPVETAKRAPAKTTPAKTAPAKTAKRAAPRAAKTAADADVDSADSDADAGTPSSKRGRRSKGTRQPRRGAK